MEALKATVAHEITKESVIDAENLMIDGKLVKSPGAMCAGDFYFRSTIVSHAFKRSWFARVILRRKDNIRHESVTTIVLSCPTCGLPILTQPTHAILKRKPLSIDGAISCPYSYPNPHSFGITEGNIMPA